MLDLRNIPLIEVGQAQASADTPPSYIAPQLATTRMIPKIARAFAAVQGDPVFDLTLEVATTIPNSGIAHWGRSGRTLGAPPLEDARHPGVSLRLGLAPSLGTSSGSGKSPHLCCPQELASPTVL